MTIIVIIVEGYPRDLSEALNEIETDGGQILHVLTNGINRWTIIYRGQQK